MPSLSSAARVSRVVAVIASALTIMSQAGVATQPTAVASASVARSVPRAVSGSHPYSDPVWYPIRDTVYLDCVVSNPGCPTNHAGWTMDMVLETIGGHAVKHPGVYAMGAGRLRYGDASGSKCNNSGHSNFGTWVYIDHGNGIVSRYGHLAKILVPKNTLVAAGQKIAIMGDTGKGGNCGVPYVDFQVRHGGVGGKRVQIKTLKVCYSSSNSADSWPAALDTMEHWRPLHPVYKKPARNPHYSVWNQVPKRSVDFPATTSACIPDGTPKTAARPASVRLSRSGPGHLTVRWAKPSAAARVNRVQLDLAEYHTSTRTWDYQQNDRFVSVAPNRTSYRFSGLRNKRAYRLEITFHNRLGNSATVGWLQRTTAPAR